MTMVIDNIIEHVLHSSIKIKIDSSFKDFCSRHLRFCDDWEDKMGFNRNRSKGLTF